MSLSTNQTSSTTSRSSQSGSSQGYPSEIAVGNEVATVLDDTMRGDDVERRKITLLRAYSQNSREKFMPNTAREMRKQLRMVISPKVKFVRDSKIFGAYDKPDFSSPNCWQNELYDRIPSLRNVSDAKRAVLWMTYRRNLRKELSNQQAKWTSGIKKEFFKRK